MLNLPFEPFGFCNEMFIGFGIPVFVIKLAALTFVLVLPMIVCMPLSAWLGPWAKSPVLLARAGLTLLLLTTSSAHLIDPSSAMLMLPGWFPLRFGVIFAADVLQVVLAISLWIPGWRRLAGIAIVILLVVFLPADIYGAWNAGMYSGEALGPAYLLARVPLQIMLIVWTVWVTCVGDSARASMVNAVKDEQWPRRASS